MFVAIGLVRPETTMNRANPLSAIDLVIHEAGHVLFGSFGNELIMFLGGSALQVLVPVGFAASFALRRDSFAAAVMGLWAAYNLADVAVYVADAPLRALPLLTDDPDTHDWYNIFSSVGHLEFAAPTARALFALAWVTLAIATFAVLWSHLPRDEG